MSKSRKIFVCTAVLLILASEGIYRYYRKKSAPPETPSVPATASTTAQESTEPSTKGSNIYKDPHWRFTMRYPLDYRGQENGGTLDLFHTNASGAEVLAVQTAVYENFVGHDPKDTTTPLDKLVVQEIQRQCATGGPTGSVSCVNPDSRQFQNPFGIKGWEITMTKITETNNFDSRTETNLGKGPSGGIITDKKGVGPIYALDISAYTTARALFIVPTDIAYASGATFVINSIRFPTGTNQNGK